MGRFGQYGDIIKSTGTYAIAEIGARFVSFLLVPIYTRFLTSADYGVLELLDITVNTVSVLLGLRIGQALLYYHAEATDPLEKDAYVTTALFGALGTAVISVLIMVPAAPAVSRLILGTGQYALYFQMMFVGMAFGIPIEVGMAYMRADNRSGTYVATYLARTTAAAAANVALLTWWHMGLKGLMWSTLVSSLATAGFVSWYGFSRVRVVFRRQFVAPLFRYSAPLVITGIAFFVMHSGDRYFLRLYGSALQDIGIYALAYKFGFVIAFVEAPFTTYWFARMYYVIKEDNGEQVWVRSFTYMFLVLTGICVALFLLIQPLFHIIVGPGFRQAAMYVPWIAVAYLLRACSSFFRSVFFLEKKTGMDAQTTAGSALVCLAAYAVLIPPLKLWGAVWATAVTFLFMAAFSYYRAQRVRRFHFEWLRLLRIAVAAVVPCSILVVLRPSGFWTQMAAAAALLPVFPLGLVVTGFLRPGEKAALRDLLASCFRRRRIAAAPQ